MAKQIAIYLRVSKRRGQNTASQEPELRRWAEGQGEGTEVRWYRDQFTGKTMDRPGFGKLMRAVEAVEVQTIAGGFPTEVRKLSQRFWDSLNGQEGTAIARPQFRGIARPSRFGGNLGASPRWSRSVTVGLSPSCQGDLLLEAAENAGFTSPDSGEPSLSAIRPFDGLPVGPNFVDGSCEKFRTFVGNTLQTLFEPRRRTCFTVRAREHIIRVVPLRGSNVATTTQAGHRTSFY